MKRSTSARAPQGWPIWLLFFATMALRAQGPPPRVPQLDREQRIADLRSFVDEIRRRHPAPYEQTAPSRWDERLAELERGVEELDASGFFFRLQEAAALVDDIHTSAFPLAEQGILLQTYPIRLRRSGDAVYVRAARQALAGLLGSRVLAIEGRPVGDVIQEVLRIAPGNRRTPHSNVPLAYLLTPATYRYLGILAGTDSLRLTVLGLDGERRAVRLEPEPVSVMAAYESGSVIGWTKPDGWVALADRENASTPVFYRRRGESPIWFEPVAGGDTLMIQVNQPRPDAGNSVIRTLADLYRDFVERRYRRIVVDLRGNEGGWFSLTAALPGMIASIEAGTEPPRVFVLIGPDTTSAGVALATQLEQQTRAVFVGEPTGSSPNGYGTYKPAALPNSGIYYRISTARLVLSLPEDDRRWLAPDVPALETVAGLAAGRDAALECALGLPLELSGAAERPWQERWKRPSQASARPGAADVAVPTTPPCAAGHAKP